jgi:hypothetical protein
MKEIPRRKVHDRPRTIRRTMVPRLLRSGHNCVCVNQSRSLARKGAAQDALEKC